MSTKTNEELLVELVFTLDIKNLGNQSEIDGAIGKIKILISSLNLSDGENMPYPQITDYIYKSDDYNLESFEEQIQNLNGSAEELKSFFEKFIKHANLAITQKKYFKEQVNQANSQLKLIQNTVSESKAEFADIRKNVYTDFISILGIFSALLFGLFVGFDTFKSVIEGIASDAKITRVVIMGSLMLIGVIALTFLLLNGIAMLTGKNFKSCCEKKHCEHNLYQKYPIFSIGMLTLLIIISISSVIMITNIEGWLYDFPIWIVLILGIIVLGVLFISYAIGLIRFPSHPLTIEIDDTKTEDPSPR